MIRRCLRAALLCAVCMTFAWTFAGCERVAQVRELLTPPDPFLQETEKDQTAEDYRAMQESMIYESSPSFEQLIEKLAALNRRINDSSHCL